MRLGKWLLDSPATADEATTIVKVAVLNIGFLVALVVLTAAVTLASGGSPDLAWSALLLSVAAFFFARALDGRQWYHRLRHQDAEAAQGPA